VPVMALLLLSFSVNVVVVIVDESIVSENAAVMDVLIATSVALFAGLIDDTVGAVVSLVSDSEPHPVIRNRDKIIKRMGRYLRN